MFVTGIVLAILGCVIVMAGALALSLMKESKSDGGLPFAEALDLFFSAGLLTFLGNFFQAASKAVKERSSPEFPLAILVASGLVLLAVGGGLLWLGEG